MAKTDRDNPGIRSLFNPLWCYHGFRMSVLGLSVFGVIMVFSSSAVSSASEGKSPFTDSLGQVVVCVCGLVAGVIVSMLPVELYRKSALAVMVGALGLQALTLTPLGVGQYGNNGWIAVPGTSATFQPAEVTKLALCVWMPSALIAARRILGDHARRATWKEVVSAYRGVIIVYGAALLLVIGGKDLGTAMIVMLIGFVSMLVSGFPGGKLAVIAGVGIAVVVALVASSPNRRERVLAAYSQCTAADAQEICYQSMHARYAIASGGFLGVGLGNSREKWNYLPAAHNDFIFAIIGEETGFVGCAMVILIFVILGWCLLFSAMQAKDRYSAIALMCVATWFVGQALVNIGVVVGIFPVFGVPLPFVSSGGSSMLACLIASGFAAGLMRQQPQIKADTSRL
ncbi:peptidoglycan glycosyltransferase FtsW [Bifidobacterium stellenboschense]|uniref:Probable peptidoglycan glycosyltransferase FtsW n=1 Tax=Bifidobacterium stellenboschense TaxID=762211 RepID=A0A087DQS1_9BIFI|nr:putative peptidoglycan glycosyltransferase FtsW [Bifidobacterium stellenboschense]KFI97871.1 cell division protein FtsW [Bifidobacterium stellenboschense]